MNWWSILKVQQTLNVGTSPSKPVSEGAGITGLQQRAARSQEFQPAGDLTQPQQQTLNVNTTYNPIPQQTSTQTQVTQPKLRSGQQQLDLVNVSNQQINAPSVQTYQPSQAQQLDIQELPKDQKTLQEYEREENQISNITQNISQPTTADSGTDDSDVGEIRENVNRAKQNLSQLPRGPKAKVLTQVLTDLSAAAIDPVNQKNIAITAKKKLQEAFPQVS